MHLDLPFMRRWGMALFALFAFALPAHADITVKTTRIGHGVEAWYAKNNAVPIIDLRLSFEGAGTVSDAENKSGRAAFAAAMLNEGAGDLNAQAFAQALDEKAISLEVSAEADRLSIHIRVLREHAKRAGELLALALTQPSLAEPDMARVKTQFASLLLQLEESPGYQAQKLLAQRAFKNHPYANLPYGTAATVSAFGAADVRDYLNTYVTRDNLIVAASGDLDSGVLDDLLGPLVDALKNNDAGAVAITQITPQGGGETLRQISPLPQTVIAFVAPGVARSDKRFYAVYLLNHILGGNALSARLSQDIRQKKGLAYSVDTDLDVRRGTSLLSGALATRNGTAEAALAETKTVLATLRDQGVTTEECKDAKSYVIGHFPLQLDRTGAVSAMLLSMQVNKLGEDYLTDRVKLFNNVSCGEINALAHELLAPERFLYAVVGGKADNGAPAAPIPAATHGDAR